jgi:hypothetical protein
MEKTLHYKGYDIEVEGITVKAPGYVKYEIRLIRCPHGINLSKLQKDFKDLNIGKLILKEIERNI